MNAAPDIFFDSAFGEVEPFFIGMMIFFLIFYLLILVFGIVSYVLNSAGMYTIAKRRGIHHPWLAWLPIANSWILGSISDQFQFVTKGKVRNRRKLLLGLNITSAMIPVVILIVEVITMIVAVGTRLDPITGLPFAAFFLLWFAAMGFMILLAIFTYIALHDLYYSCNPDQAVVFLILSIFISVTQPFFVFSCRKKDRGMPPRKEAQPPVQEIPQPEEVVEDETTATEPCTAEDTDYAEEPTE